MKNLGGFVIIGVLALIVASMSLFTVDEREYAIVFQLGEVIDVKKGPGLYFKVPLVQNVRYFDSRIQTLDAAEPERFLTSEKKNVLVDAFVKWRVQDPLQYYISVGGNKALAETRLQQTINDALRAEFGRRTIPQVVSGQREEIMDILRTKADQDAKGIGVSVVDVRLKRVDLPQEVSESVYRRMEADRKEVAQKLRSQGDAESTKIRADADRQREVMLAEAYGEAQKVKGQGDAKAAALYANAYQQNPEFYSFYRSLEAYRQGFKNKSDVLVLEPNSEFFKYFRGADKPQTTRPPK